MASGLTQNEVAQKMGVVRTIVGKIERAERRLDVIELRNFCIAIGVSFTEFTNELDEVLEQAIVE